MKRAITSQGLQVIAIVTMLGVAAVILLQNFGPAAQQAHRMVLAREHISVLAPLIHHDPRFTNITLHSFTGAGGSLMPNGEVLSETDLQDLKRTVEASKPPVQTVYFVHIIPAEWRQELDKESHDPAK